jgi:alpha-D-ribose 1-methylphosphonate 5-triphosphate synthase subunit PhnH
MPATSALAPGFTDPAREAQRAFRAVMTALARPTAVQQLETALRPPSPLTPELAAIALTLADHEAPLWLDRRLTAEPAVSAFLRFHTGAAIVAEPEAAAFALIVDPEAMPPFEAFAIGSEDYPDRSATLVLALESLDGGDRLVLEGPGLQGRRVIAPRPVPGDLRGRLLANRALFPRGVDLVLTVPGRVAALPRSARLLPEA